MVWELCREAVAKLVYCKRMRLGALLLDNECCDCCPQAAGCLPVQPMTVPRQQPGAIAIAGPRRGDHAPRFSRRDLPELAVRVDRRAQIAEGHHDDRDLGAGVLRA